MSNFKVGQKVVCINIESSKSNLKLGKIYTVGEITNCKNCGFLTIKINGISTSAPFSKCKACNHFHINENNFGSYRFRPLKEQPNKIKNVINNKDIIKELIEEKADVKEKVS